MGVVGTTLSTLGDCIRAVREQRGLTLEQTAELSGISKSHLSRLESSERQPSVASLLALAEAFGVAVGALFGEDQEAAPIMVSMPDAPRRDSNGLSISLSSGYAGSSVIDALRVTLTSDRPAPAPVTHPGEELLYVVSGSLRLEYGGDAHILPAGASAHFNAELPHRLGAQAGVAEVLLVAAKPVRNLHKIH